MVEKLFDSLAIYYFAVVVWIEDNVWILIFYLIYTFYII